jgi:hypothetical protein
MRDKALESDDSEGQDDPRSEVSPEFWHLIEQRRREPTIPWDDFKAELFADEQWGRDPETA